MAISYYQGLILVPRPDKASWLGATFDIAYDPDEPVLATPTVNAQLDVIQNEGQRFDYGPVHMTGPDEVRGTAFHFTDVRGERLSLLRDRLEGGDTYMAAAFKPHDVLSLLLGTE